MKTLKSPMVWRVQSPQSHESRAVFSRLPWVKPKWHQAIVVWAHVS